MLCVAAGRHGGLISDAIGGGLRRGRVVTPGFGIPLHGSPSDAVRGLGRRVVVGGSLVPASDGLVLQAQADGDLEGGCGPLARPRACAALAGGAATHVVPSVAGGGGPPSPRAGRARPDPPPGEQRARPAPPPPTGGPP